jgi:hypothetical protein
MNLEVKNNGTSPISLTSIDAPASPFSLDTSLALPVSIDPGNSTILKVKFAPTAAGSYNSSMGLLFDSSTSPFIINLSGVGGSQTIAPNLAFTKNSSTITSSAFGSVYIGATLTSQYAISNIGASAITVDSMTLPTDGFTTNLIVPFTLQAGESKAFNITFAPTQAKSYSGVITLKDSVALFTSQLSLTGSGSSVLVQAKIASTGATLSNVVFSALTQQQLAAYASTKPAGVGTPTSGIQFRVDGLNTNTPDTITANATFASLPTDPKFYKIVNGTWIELTNYTINGNTVSFSITDNSSLDSDITLGSIVDPIVVVGSSSGTTGQAGVSNPPPSSGGGGGGCFIATAAYGSYLDPHVMALRHFRDNVLLQSEFGTAFVKFYYKHSPPVADFIAEHDTLRMIFRLALTPLVFAVKFPLASALLLTIGIAALIVRRIHRLRCSQTSSQTA